MKKFIPVFLALSLACGWTASLRADVRRLAPVAVPTKAPAVCKIIGILPDSPAQKAGLQIGDRIQSINGVKPLDATTVADLIQQSGPVADIEVVNSSGPSRSVKATLNKERPRLGAICDLYGWRKNSVSSAGNESVTVFDGPYAFTVSGILDKGLAFIRIRLTNLSDKPLPVNRALFSLVDASSATLPVLSPAEVMYFIDGEDSVALLKPPPASPGVEPETLTVPADSGVRQSSTKHKTRKEWSRQEESYVRANADYLNKESLWASQVVPGGVADGLIYCLEPKALPFTIKAHVQPYTYSAAFELPQPSTGHMSQEDLEKFFDAQKKETPLRITLKSGKVFVGRYSSYDSINEIVWFDTPSGVLLTTSSFGLKYIVSAEVISPQNDKKPTADAAN